MDDFAYVPVGTNRLRAQVIVEACRAAGLVVELLASDDSGYGNIYPHRLLVRSADREQVMAAIEESGINGGE
jgi:hypothetical protein